MKTIVLSKPGLFEVEDRPEPEPLKSGEALVSIRRVGVCGTDLHAFKGDQPFFSYPRVLGHELGVEVVAVHESNGQLDIGDFCTVEPYLHCGRCGPCKKGRTNCCESLHVFGVHSDGGLCKFMKVPAAKLHRSSNLPLEHLALVEMLSIGAHAVSRSGATARDHVLVIGAGPIGLGVTQFAQLIGAEPVVLEVDQQRRDFCQRFLGIEHCVAPTDDTQEQLRHYFDGNLPDIVFDATGNRASMHAAFGLVASGGTLVLVGLFVGDLSFHDPEFHRKELTLMSSRNATSADFNYVIQMLESGKINLTPWITHRAAFDDMITTFPTWLKRETGVVKAMIDID